jgi:hypothetical protein
MRLYGRLLGPLLCLCVCCGTAGGQVSTGTISGTVTDASSAAVPGATVVVTNQDTAIARTVQADADGHYSVPSLNPGNYRVTATHEGFKTQIRDGIVLTVAREEVVDLALAVGSVDQSVVVTGGAPLVETTTASLASLVDDETIRALPLNGRSWDQLGLSRPGVIATNQGPVTGNQFNYGTGKRFSVGGQRPDANLYLLDGADVNDQANGTPGGAGGTNLGVDTILEFQIFTNSYEAEYGHSMGSVTTAVTRSGTNDFHGTAFEYIRNHVLDAKNYFDAGSSPPPFIRNQFGGVLGGPIKKDKTFFFGGYEGLRQGLGTTLFATVPTALARQGTLPSGNVTVNPVVVPYLNLYPLPNGRNFGDGTAQFVSAPTIVTNEDNFMVRVDHQLDANNSIFGRYSFDRDYVNAPQSIPTETALNSDRRQYATIQWNTVLGAKALNNFRFAFNRDAALTAFSYSSAVPTDLSFVPDQPVGAIQLGVIGTAGSRAITPFGPTNGNGPQTWYYNVFQWSDDVSYNVGKHSIKWGGDIERFRYNQNNNGDLWGVYTFPTFTAFLQGVPSALQASSPLGQPFLSEFRQTLLALYVQDDYKLTSRFTLNLGIRWEATTDPYSADGNTEELPSLASPITVPARSFFNALKNNFEPRIGLAWQLDSSGKTVLRSAFGVYQNQILPWFYQVQGKNPPFAGLLTLTNPSFPNGATGLIPAASLQLLQMAPYQKTPTNYQYNLSLQREIFKNTMVQVDYAGNRAEHLETEIEGDTATPIICSTSLDNCPTGIANGQPYYPPNDPRRNPAWAGIRYYQSNGNSEYDSGTVTLRHQSSNGFVGEIHYTYSKALDDSSGISPAESERSPQSIMYPGDFSRDWGLSDFDAKHLLGGSITYPLPFRVGWHALGALVNGWRLDSIATFSSGQPFTPLLATSRSRDLSTAGSSERPNLNPGYSDNPNHGVSAGCPGFAAGTPVGNALNWFDPCAFSLPIAGTFGDLRRNTIIGPKLADVDFAVEKNFKITERFNTTFRAEAFNILNHANLGLPDTTALAASGAANPAAGSITYTETSSRQLQFALRVNF